EKQLPQLDDGDVLMSLFHVTPPCPLSGSSRRLPTCDGVRRSPCTRRRVASARTLRAGTAWKCRRRRAPGAHSVGAPRSTRGTSERGARERPATGPSAPTLARTRAARCPPRRLRSGAREGCRPSRPLLACDEAPRATSASFRGREARAAPA